MPDIFFESEWLKIDQNVKEGDHIAFQNEGEYDQERDRWIFDVAIIRNGGQVGVKKFSLNRTNAKAVINEYGTKSENWVNKEMRVNKESVRNPSTGLKVDSILLSAPNRDKEGNVILQ